MPSLRTRLFHAYARLRRPMTLGVRGLVENSDGQILLVRHTYISGWHMRDPEPGRHVFKPHLISE